jgi:hypothetical protein
MEIIWYTFIIAFFWMLWPKEGEDNNNNRDSNKD